MKKRAAAEGVAGDARNQSGEEAKRQKLGKTSGKKRKKDDTQKVGSRAGRPAVAQANNDERRRAGALRKAQELRDARQWTVSLALPGSIIANAQTLELKTYLAGEIARALSIFSVDEVVVFEDDPDGTSQKAKSADHNYDRQKKSDPCSFLCRVLQVRACGNPKRFSVLQLYAC